MKVETHVEKWSSRSKWWDIRDWRLDWMTAKGETIGGHRFREIELWVGPLYLACACKIAKW